MTEPTNLHALLGDRYDAVMQAACGCDGTRLPHCFECGDSTWDHECPAPVPCRHRGAGAVLARVLPGLLAEARRDGAWDAIEHMGDELGWTHTPNCAGRVSFPTSPPVCICHADVLRDMRGRFNYPADHDRTDHA